MKITPEAKIHQLTVYIPDTRGVTVSRFGKGNLKLGTDGVYTYSRLPGLPTKAALGSGYLDNFVAHLDGMEGTCPGATEECQAICYAARPVEENGAVAKMWRTNSYREDVPSELPPDAKIVRIHVSGDFTSPGYIAGWRVLALRNPDVKFWAYTRSWRVPELLVYLEKLRALPNVQLFASMDKSTQELPPEGWRRAWIDGDVRVAGSVHDSKDHLRTAFDGTSAYVCPEQTGYKANCQQCDYCISGQSKDVLFLQH